MSADPTAALARILNATEVERLHYRMMYLATLEQLHFAQQTIDEQAEKLAKERAQLRRFCIGIFGEPQ